MNKLLRTGRRRPSVVHVRATPTVSVVMPVFNTVEYLAAATSSVLSQSYRAVELVVVDDGSTDGSADVLRALASQDDRVRVLTQANAGLGVARNAGVAAAAGDYLCFVDSDDLLRPGALGHLVRTLERSGSDVVSGSYRRGAEWTALTPQWLLDTHATRRTGLTIEDHPRMLLDVTPCNKLFRRTFWDRCGLSFPEDRRYEDQVPITRALLKGSFDVTSRDVYLWRTRAEHSSITQQKGRVVDLRARIATQADTLSLIEEHGSALLRTTWLHKVLGFDLPGYVESSLTADGEYWDLLEARFAELLADARTDDLVGVALYPRVASWLAAAGRRAHVEDLFEYNRLNPRGWPLAARPGGGLRAVPRVAAEVLADVPPSLLDVEEVDVEGRAVLTSARWEGDVLEVGGLAYLTNTLEDVADVEVSARLVDRRARVTVTVPTRHLDFSAQEAHEVAGRPHEAHLGGGFTLAVDASSLAHEHRDADWELTLEVTAGGHQRLVERPTVVARSSVDLREPHVVGGDYLVGVAGDSRSGVRVRVRRTWSSLDQVEPGATGSRRLQVTGPVGDPVVRLDAVAGDRHLALAADDAEPLTAVLPVGVLDDLGVDTAHLRATHASGRVSKVLWSFDPPAVDLGTGTETRVGPSGLARLYRGGATAWVTSVQVCDGDHGIEARVAGWVNGPGGHLGLRRGARRAGESIEVGAGPFEVALPLEDEHWGLGRRPLRDGGYLIVLETPDARRPLLSTFTLRRRGRQHTLTSAGRWTVGADGDGQVFLVHDSLADDRAPFVRAQLIEDVYPTARESGPVDAVLFECFSGRTAGDSPAAICAELVRRGAPLDLVWGVADGSVAVPDGARPVVRESREWFELLGRARFLVANGNLPSYFVKADHQVHVQTWHGTPLKRIGHDVRSFVDPLYLRLLDREAARWDLLVSASPYTSDILPRALAFSRRPTEIGHPRNDSLVQPDDRRDDVRRRLGISADERVVLYAPTWRENRLAGTYYAKVLHLDAQRLADENPGTVVLVRGHANTSFDTSDRVSRTVLDVTLYPDVNDLMLAADALVTDYSSVMFDFVLLDKPVILLVPDLESYRDSLRGFYFDIESDAPGPLVHSTDEVAWALDSPDVHAEARRRYRSRFAPHDDGGAAARVVDQMDVLAHGTSRSMATGMR